MQNTNNGRCYFTAIQCNLIFSLFSVTKDTAFRAHYAMLKATYTCVTFFCTIRSQPSGFRTGKFPCKHYIVKKTPQRFASQLAFSRSLARWHNLDNTCCAKDVLNNYGILFSHL